MRTAIKQSIKSALLYSGAPNLVARGLATRAVILRYHSILDEPERFANSIGPGIIHSTKTFREHMEILARRCQPLTLDDLLLSLAGVKNLPHRGVLVTFDDGYADNYEFAAPILDHYGISGTFYLGVDPIDQVSVPWFCRLRYAFSVSKRETVFDAEENRFRALKEPEDRYAVFLSASRRCACLVGSDQELAVQEFEKQLEVVPLASKDCRMLTWDQVRLLRRRGHTIGSHTLTHPNVAQIDVEEAKRELLNSKQRLEQVLGEPIVHFSYPSPILEPHYTEQTVKICEQTGYKTAVTCTSGAVTAHHHPLSMPRIPSAWDTIQFRWNLEWAFLGGRP